ncbi:heterokaryon incompatibility protein-domain-containing protein [Paraphoma chrysanthemicola]|uniref:Heterokaryon incompatibility protein-domain-containing protein n=1 Tax=Paraphoma chrysanthemicola TaxID=798071 RepID=A0A8K0QW91_9PLEO|nr:heterokaryon incompatibility protein-domain-containing protein [Paraphoma chrysanthemicola]
MEAEASPAAKASTRPNFVYEPLQGPGFSIRLLVVLPREDEIHVRIWESITDEGYQCLSYTWATPRPGVQDGPSIAKSRGHPSIGSSDAHEIVVNECSLTVGTNLYHFLQFASQKYANTPLWVDAISINQEDDIEKGEQVERMADIYADADWTLLWLGHCPHLDIAFDALKVKSWRTREKRNETRKSLELFCSHPYWKRTWITQEVLTSNGLTILSAGKTCNWEDVVRSSWFEAIDKQHTGVLWALEDLRKKRVQSFGASYGCGFRERQSIWDLLRWRNETECSDPRDRVYGCRALVKDGVLLKVDYSEPAVQLFWRAGSNFCAWNSFRFMQDLRKALELNVTQILASLEEDPSIELTIDVWNVSSNFAGFSRKKQIECKQETCKSQLPHFSKIASKFRRDRLLCTNSGFGPSDVFHALIHPPSAKESMGITLISYIRGYQHESSLDISVLQHSTGPDWISISDRSYIDSNLTSKSVDKGHWRLRIPAKVLTTHYQVWHQKEYDRSTSMEELRNESEPS